MATQVERRNRTRAAIIDAAFKAFERNGSPDVALDEIAQAAGVTKGTIHYHFSNRIGLLEQVAVRLFIELEATAARRDIGEPISAREYLQSLLEQQASSVGRVLFTIGDELLRVGSLDAIDPYRFLRKQLDELGVTGSSMVVAGAAMQFGRQLAFGLAEPADIAVMLDELDL